MSTRKTLATLVAFIGLVGLVLVNVGGASGLHVDPADDVLRLHLDSDGDYFEHGDDVESVTQMLDESGCVVDDASQEGPLVSLLSGSTKPVGLSFDSLGIKSQGPGRSCGRVDGSEEFTISINNGEDQVLEGLNVYKMELDIEAKQDARLRVTVKLDELEVGSFELRSGDSVVAGEGTEPDPGTQWLAISTSADPIANCLGLTDSGPDNGASDNCRWVVESDFPFDAVTFTVLAGAAGFEGGEDGTAAATSGYGSDSLFFLTDIPTLNCGDTVATGDAVGEPLVSVTRQFQDGCKLKDYFLGSSSTNPVAGSQSFTFEPTGSGPGQAGATYDVSVIWVAEPALPQLPVTQMDFNGDGDANDDLEGDLVWCDGTTAAPVLPSTGEPWCRYEQNVLLVGTGFVQMTERLIGSQDPSGWR
ncbi:MAG: hypothetical protein OEM22_08885 [Acidimicrobiia bacterium]|nr:hypothetical protein [Acidimicrobiia bacterium]MDH3469870.1 hypothetical protein [Acidimicrobiia bacterium]